MSVFVHAQGIKTVHAGGWVKKWQNSVHVVVEGPLSSPSLLPGKGVSDSKSLLDYCEYLARICVNLNFCFPAAFHLLTKGAGKFKYSQLLSRSSH